MKDRIQQLAQGEVYVQIPELTFTPDNLNKSVPAGAVMSLDIQVKSKNKVPYKAFFYSTDERVRVCTPSSAGLLGTVSLEISTRTCEVGDEISGSLQVVSNAGEKRLDYHFTVTGSDSRVGQLQTLEEFAVYCCENGRQAQRLFSSPQFIRFPFMKDPFRLAVYEGVLGGAREEQALESFLVACGMKEPVVFTADRVREELEARTEELRGQVSLHVNTWGSLRIRIHTDVDWLTVKKSMLTEADFTQEREAQILYRVDAKALHAGRNIGEIVFQSDTQSVSVFIEVYNAFGKRQKREGADAELTESLYRMLLEYINHTYEDQVILAALDRNLTGFIKKYPSDFSLYLFRAWLLVENDHRKEARAILDWCRDAIRQTSAESPVRYCVFLYIDSRAREDVHVTENACKIIHKYFESVPSLIIAILELFVIRMAGDQEAVAFLEELQKSYGSSPLIYALAARLYRSNPELMKGNSPFMLYVFNYMLKYRCYTDEVIASFLKQDFRFAANSPLLLSVLERLYEEVRTPQTLMAVLSVLVRQGKTGKKYFPWYEEGIRREIPLTGLNDYYLASLSLDDNSRLPVSLLLYYSYKSELDDQTRINLYYYILCHYPKQSEMYRAYEEQMSQFAVSCLLSGKINSRLVLLYENFLNPLLVDKKLGKVLPDILFSRQITTTLSYAEKVVVHYPQLSREIVRPLVDRQACVPVYTENVAILFEDKYGNRYVDPAYLSERLMKQTDLIEACRQQSPNQLMLLLEETYQLYQKPIQDDSSYERVCLLMENAELEPAYRQFLAERRVDYCYYCAQKQKKETTPEALGEKSAEWLLSLDLMQFDSFHRVRVMELYIFLGRMKEAYKAVCLFGSGQLKISALLKMTVRYITEILYDYDERLVQIGMYLLQKKQWNEVLLNYLSQHYNGTTDSMLQLLLLTQELKTDSADLAERVTAQMIFTGNWSRIDEAYACYQKSGPVVEIVKRAYLVLKSHLYLTGRENISAENLQVIEAAVMKEDHSGLPAGFFLALLKYYGGIPALNDRQRKLCEMLVYGLCAKEFYLKSYLALGRHIEMPHQMEGKLIIQESAEPDQELWVEGKLMPKGESLRCPMNQVYPGIYTCAVFLFADEYLEGEVYKNTANGPEKIDTLVLRAHGCYARKDSRYDKICRAIRYFEEDNLEEMKRFCARTEREKRVARDLFLLM